MTSLKLVARPLRSGEPDLLSGKETSSLVIRDLRGMHFLHLEPRAEWTHAQLEMAVCSADVVAFVREHGGADAYLADDQWIGSTEI